VKTLKLAFSGLNVKESKAFCGDLPALAETVWMNETNEKSRAFGKEK